MIPWWSHSSVPGIHTHSQHLNSWRRCILTRYTCIRYLEHRKYSYAGYYIDNDVEMYTIVMFLCSVVIMCLLGPYSQTLSTPTINIFKSHKGDESGSLECFFFSLVFHLFFTCHLFHFFHLFFSFFSLVFSIECFFFHLFFSQLTTTKTLLVVDVQVPRRLRAWTLLLCLLYNVSSACVSLLRCV